MVRHIRTAALYGLGVLLFQLGSGGLTIKAQDLQASPISRYGLGVLSNASPTAYRGMGGVGIALADPKHPNFLNPAAYAATDSLSFLMDIAGSVNWGRYSDSQTHKNTFLGGLDYVALQFPLWRDKVALSAGIIPFSTAGYNSQRTVALKDDTFTTIQQFSGTGSLQTVYAGIGTKIYGGLTLGVNLSYLFGKITHSVTNSPNTSVGTTERTVSALRVNNLLLDLGTQYKFTVKKNQVVTVGAVFSPSLKLTPKQTISTERNYGTVSQPEITSERTQLALKSPMQIGGGVSWEGYNKLLVSADVKVKRWEETYNPFKPDNVTLHTSYLTALGIQYRNDPYSRDYADKIYYRGGLNYNTGYLSVGSLGRVDRVGLSLGLGLPVTAIDDRTSYIDLALEYSKAYAPKSKLLNEDYLRLTVSLNFNETWFRKLLIY